MNLVITTYPLHGSANVGDLLITNSFIDIAQSIGVMTTYETVFREMPLSDEQLAKYGDTPIFMPGFSISDGTHPTLYALRPRVDEIPYGVIPFGSTWQHAIGYAEHAEMASYSPQTLALLESIARRTGHIGVRDHMAHAILLRWRIPSAMVGDCAWYHLPSVGKPMRRPTQITRIAVTTPHNKNLVGQSIDVIKMLRQQFPDANVTVSLHSNPIPATEPILRTAEEFGCSVIYAAGDVGIFDRYDDFDLHVGHRLHGHIGFLRRRIPSVLLMEDARSRGFSHSIPVGCFSAKNASFGPHVIARLPMKVAQQHVSPDPYAVLRVREFLIQELQTKFLRYIGVAPYLDQMLTEVAIPHLRHKVDMAMNTSKAA